MADRGGSLHTRIDAPGEMPTGLPAYSSTIAAPIRLIADALEQIINIRFPRLFAEKAPPVTYRSTATNSMVDKPPAE
jgi:hypothetical protein